jgi:hypothetical protein
MVKLLMDIDHQPRSAILSSSGNYIKDDASVVRWEV